MKSFSINKKICSIIALVFTFILSLVCAFAVSGMANAKATDFSKETVKSEYDAYLATYTGSSPEKDFIKTVEENSDKKYFSRLGYEDKEKLSNETIEFVQYVFGIDPNEFLNSGGTIGDANGEKWTGSYVSSSLNNVPAGGASIEDGDFSVIVMGDQQTAVEYHSAMVASSYDWIVANAEAMNLKMYINVGDIVDDTKWISWRNTGGNDRYEVNFHPGRMGNWQWQQKFAITQAEKLLNANIPSAFTMGNHDYGDMAESLRIKDAFINDFKFDKFNTVSNGYGGALYPNEEVPASLYNDIEAAWYEFTANNQKYMVVVLGCYPTTEILNWANNVVSTHPDHKVIVTTHAYMDGPSQDVREDGMVIWDDFASKHSNIIMLVNGHECTDDGSIIKRVDYGINGNAVTQLMINPQVEEFGGAGTFAQLIFRTDGTVDLVYYSPYSNDHNNGNGYFMNENQFTFSLNPTKLALSEAELEKEVVIDTDLYTDSTSVTYQYFAYDVEDETEVPTPTEGVYAYNNAIFTQRGITAINEGKFYVVHKLYAGDYKRFCKLSLNVVGDFVGSEFGAYQVEFSTDGLNYQTALYNNSETGVFGRDFVLDRFAAGAEFLYVRVLAENAIISKLNIKGDSVRTVFTDENFILEYNFSNEIDPSSYVDWNMKGAYSKYYAVLSGNILGSGGSGRMSYKSNVTYRFDSGDQKRHFEEFYVDLLFRAQYLRSKAEGYDFSQKEGLQYILELSVSIDNGNTFVPIKQFSEADCGVDANTPSKDCWINETVLSEDIIKNKFNEAEITSFILKIDYFGAGNERAHAGLYDIKLSGKLNKEIKVKEDVEYTKTYVLNGGYFEDVNSTVPKRSGYEFKGWYLTEDFEGAQVDPSNIVYNENNYTFYAKWQRAYYITYFLDGGVNSVNNLNMISDDGLLVLSDATKEGKLFMGWYDQNGNAIKSVSGSDLSEDLVLYAVWTDPVESAEGCSSNADSDFAFVAVVPLMALAFVALKKNFAKKQK